MARLSRLAVLPPPPLPLPPLSPRSFTNASSFSLDLKGVAFVTYATPQMASQAAESMDGQDFRGIALSVQKRMHAHVPFDDKLTICIVRNSMFPKNDILDLCSQFGTVIGAAFTAPTCFITYMVSPPSPSIFLPSLLTRLVFLRLQTRPRMP